MNKSSSSRKEVSSLLVVLKKKVWITKPSEHKVCGKVEFECRTSLPALPVAGHYVRIMPLDDELVQRVVLEANGRDDDTDAEITLEPTSANADGVEVTKGWVEENVIRPHQEAGWSVEVAWCPLAES